MQFIEFPKIFRLQREVIVTEKIDGTNAQVTVFGSDEADLPPCTIVGDLAVAAGSRNRWISPDADNFGFARWVYEHAEELAALGTGRHYGEWWGQGIQRGYGLKERRFSLFNVERWKDDRPSCCHVVPELWRGFLGDMPEPESLLAAGSIASPQFGRPEGIVVYHTAGNVGFKYTFGGDGHKGSGK